MHRRRIRKRNIKKQRKAIIFSIITVLSIFSVGYAAFSTNIDIKVTGNIGQKPFNVEKIKEKLVMSGDGLYIDDTEEERYIYKGGNVENYIMLGNEMFRIISIEPNNELKLLKDEIIANIYLDPLSNQSNRTAYNTYNDDNADYCGHAYYQNEYTGCNVWGSKTTMKDKNKNNITEMAFDIGGSWSDTKFANKKYTLPNSESSANTYLNTMYFNKFSNKVQNLIVTHDYFVGVLDAANSNLENDISQEKNNIWTGKIGLINPTDYVKASTNSNCTSVKKYSYKLWGTGGTEDCYDGKEQENWMYLPISFSTINPIARPWSGYVWSVYVNGSLYRMGGIDQGLRPVLFLSSQIKMIGHGTKEEPYKVLVN